MKKSPALLSCLVVFLAGLFFTSCSSEKNLIIEKRHYGNGYYVHVGNHSDKKESVAENKKPVYAPTVETVLPEQKSVATKQSAQTTLSPSVNVPMKTAVAKTISPSGKNVFQKIQHNDPSHNKIDSPKTKMNVLKPNAKQAEDSLTLLLYIILAIILAPLAVLLKEGVTKRFWIDLLLWLIGFGVVFASFFGGLIVLLAIVYAILIVADII